MRTNIEFKLTCSVCGDELEADGEASRMRYSSAYNASANMAIKPCARCYSEAKEPARMINQAIKMMEARK